MMITLLPLLLVGFPYQTNNAFNRLFKIIHHLAWIIGLRQYFLGFCKIVPYDHMSEIVHMHIFVCTFEPDDHGNLSCEFL